MRTDLRKGDGVDMVVGNLLTLLNAIEDTCLEWIDVYKLDPRAVAKKLAEYFGRDEKYLELVLAFYWGSWQLRLDEAREAPVAEEEGKDQLPAGTFFEKASGGEPPVDGAATDAPAEAVQPPSADASSATSVPAEAVQPPASDASAPDSALTPEVVPPQPAE